MRIAISKFFFIVSQFLLNPWCFVGVVTLMVWYAIIALTPATQFLDWRQSKIQVLLGRDVIAIPNQHIVNDEIIIPLVHLRESGFAVVLLGDSFHSPSDYVVGTSGLLPKGISKNVRIVLHPDDFTRTPPGPVVQIGSSLFITAFYDQGDGEFDWNEKIVRGIFGQPLLVRFRAI